MKTARLPLKQQLVPVVFFRRCAKGFAVTHYMVSVYGQQLLRGAAGMVTI